MADPHVIWWPADLNWSESLAPNGIYWPHTNHIRSTTNHINNCISILEFHYLSYNGENILLCYKQQFAIEAFIINVFYCTTKIQKFESVHHDWIASNSNVFKDMQPFIFELEIKKNPQRTMNLTVNHYKEFRNVIACTGGG